MVSILRKPSRKARLPHYGHDMSRRVLFTSSVGHIIPVMFDFLSAGDKIVCRDRLFTRTQPLKTCAYVRVTEHIYYFFVPISQIDSYHGQSHYGISDFNNTNDITPITDASGGENPAILRRSFYGTPALRPVITYDKLFDTLFGSRSTATGVMPSPLCVDYLEDAGTSTQQLTRYIIQPSFGCIDEYGIPLLWNAVRLLDMLEYGTQYLTNDYSGSDGSTDNLVGLGFNPNLLAVYQKIWYDFFRISSWTACNPFAYNLNYGIKNGSFDSYIEPYYKVVNNDGVKAENSNLLTLHYHPLKKDFFTNIEPNPLFDVTDTSGYASSLWGQDLSLNSVGNLILSSYGIQLQGQNANALLNGSVNMGVGLNNGQNDVIIEGTRKDSTSQTLVNSVQQLRLAYAYERFLAITQRAGKHYDDQVRAHLGVSIPQGVSNEVYFLGCHSSNLMIGEVVGTAAGSYEDSSSVLGEIAGRGLGVSRSKQKAIKFHAPDDGYLMAVYCAVPEVDYKDYGINRINLYNSVNDWPRPEFDRLGMQPIYLLQSNQLLNGVLGENYVPSFNSVFGWQYRWSELKLSYDIVHGAFNHTLSDWSSSTYFGAFGDLRFNLYCPPSYLDGIFAVNFLPVPQRVTYGTSESPTTSNTAEWVLSIKTPSSISGLTINSKPVSYWMYGVSGMPDTATDDPIWSSSLMYSRDPLLHSIDFDYKKSSWMSPYGLPNL